MDSPINADIIAFAADLALAINILGAVVFTVVMRHLWVASGRSPSTTTSKSADHRRAVQGRTVTCPAL